VARTEKKVVKPTPKTRTTATPRNNRGLSVDSKPGASKARHAASEKAEQSGLTEQQKRFADEYLIDLNATAAYKRAGYRATGRSAIVNASRLLTNADLQKYLREQYAARAHRVELRQDDVVRELQAIMSVDPNEIVSFRRECCRHCWGKGHAYQFRTKRELDSTRRAHAKDLRAAQKAEIPEPDWPVFDASGGLGFDPSREPSAECPECNGAGFGRVFIADTRRLSPAAKSLYAGVKHTKDGIEVRLHSKEKAIELVMRHLGMLKDRVEVSVVDGMAERLAAARARRARLAAGQTETTERGEE
jgi:phage terminase small subunit